MLSKLFLLATLTSVSALPKVCIFDIDHTLTRGSTSRPSKCETTRFEDELAESDPAAYGRAAIANCVAMNFSVAVASAEASWYIEGKKEFLTLISDGVFDAAFFSTPAFQHGGLLPEMDKKPEYTNILNYFGATPSCAIVFDDSAMNGKAATDLGLNWQVASSSCDGSQLW